jgi:NADH:ubiquinone oxidoreductase subunit K
MPQINCYLGVSAILFCIGLFGVMTRRNAVGILMSIELMLNAANINLVAFSAYRPDHALAGVGVGQLFTVFVITIAAAEAAVGLAIIINLYVNLKHVNVDKVNLMKW